VDDEDTWVGPVPHFDLPAAMTADTDEWEDTDRSIEAQGTIDESPQMFEDTGVVIVDKPAELGAPNDRLVVTFRRPAMVTFREPRAATAEGWPPAPRRPAPIRERAFKHAAVYTIVARPETKN
jgi:hypothetical protein